MDKAYELRIDIAQKILGLGKDNVQAELWVAANRFLADFLNHRTAMSEPSLPWEQAQKALDTIPGF